MSIDKIRREYDRNALHQDHLHPEPHEQFKLWFDAAVNSKELIDPTAMLLATYHPQHFLSQRIVLLKGSSPEGYVFYTNYNSNKAQTLLSTPQCNLHFAWLPLERQVSISGVAEKLSDADNDTYFASRPRNSQLAAWASEQSKPIADRHALDTQFHALEERFKDEPSIPRPPHWGGFIVKPTQYEFWQGAKARLHDRFVYTRLADNTWQQQRLQP
ncbi:pyridoxamine 5'-phosphate oxidase [Aliidiomarina taiwanensis]|uniref:Pyridoxine/pyridoxamine 5'-phosphate oxidase n=1 Tax=Aliidiomarina taiwanensis TaxID=946228 RepID=A0A432WZ56_9GAMM|nr:pyridoxamine 5'-phosphate oxidase [Aliidiomarina taiwanensis]RUO39053.1 pyridoxamine 5'-phosphate oxidase [Aliidiomarina taiwanensis]